MNDHLKEFLAVIVLYKCDIEKSKSIVTLNDSVKYIGNLRLDVLVYDNSEYRAKPIKLDLLPHLNLIYNHDKSNPGVSSAYNYGARKAVSLQKKWLILFDQDTDIASEYLSKLIHSISIFQNENLFAPRLVEGNNILSPCKYKYKRGSSFKTLENGITNLRGKNLLNSGITINLDLFLKVGGYNEEVKLYYSDFVFIDRLKLFIRTFVLIDIELKHTMSSNDEEDSEAFLFRFSLYCQGAKQALKYSNFLGKLLYYLSSLGRALKLTFKLKTFRFLYLWINCFMTNQSNSI